MEEDDFSSDSSDEDYIPDAGEQLSEEEESGDEEDFIPDQDDNVAEGDASIPKSSAQKSKSGKAKHSKKKTKVSGLSTRRRKGGIKLEEEVPATEQQPVTAVVAESIVDNCLSEIAEAKKEEQLKKKADDLWSDFLKDVGGSKSAVVKSSTTVSGSSQPSTSVSVKKVETPKPATVKVTKEYDFAGETVTVVKEVLADSKEARLASSSQSDVKSDGASSSAPISLGLKRPSTGGLGSVLNKINKKEKISVLDKSKIDWDGFKQKEGIEDELKTHNRGKDGYLERQAFLLRTDYRQFEIERDLRLTSRPTNSQPTKKL